MHPLHCLKDTSRLGTESFLQHPVDADPALQRIGDCARLLENLLEHVMTVLALERGIRSNARSLHRTLGRIALTIVNLDALQRDVGHITVFQKNEALCLRHERCNIRGNQHGLVGQADDQRAAAPRGDQSTRFIAADHPQSIGPLEVLNRRLHRREQVMAVLQVTVHLMYDHFSIRLRSKAVSGLLLLFSQRIVILDDAVMHQRNTSVADMRMGILLAGYAMGRPAGVGDAGQPFNGHLLHSLLQLGDLADPAHPREFDLCALNDDAGRVVTAVF